MKTNWRGYFLKEGRAHFLYEVVLPDGVRLSIQETPDYFTSEQVLPEPALDELALVHGLPTLYRSFLVDAIPDGVLLYARLRSDGEHLLRRELYPPGVLRNERVLEDASNAASAKKTFVSELVFSQASLLANVVSFYEPLPDLPAADKAKGDAKPAAKQPAAPKSNGDAPAEPKQDR
ncbi:MAG: hypothetical protein IPJ77_03295 [Planctomycetes bacterium]|nr:hypothetical protein [Planctomycetota bacterium]